MSGKVKIKRPKKEDNSFDVSFKGLTQGQLMAMYRALEYYGSPVGQDVFGFLRNGINSSEDDTIRNLMK